VKVIIAGGRDVRLAHSVQSIIDDSKFEISELVCGMASGADQIGFCWAGVNGIPVKEFPANWDKHGRAAGPIRNKEMAEYADALILIWDGKSRGSASMLREAKKLDLKIFQHTKALS